MQLIAHTHCLLFLFTVTLLLLFQTRKGLNWNVQLTEAHLVSTVSYTLACWGQKENGICLWTMFWSLEIIQFLLLTDRGSTVIVWVFLIFSLNQPENMFEFTFIVLRRWYKSETDNKRKKTFSPCFVWCFFFLTFILSLNCADSSYSQLCCNFKLHMSAVLFSFFLYCMFFFFLPSLLYSA